ncbi:anti-sigma factor [Mycobacterium sp. 94-17]|uniref:anti-sigma factor n=1 Tax=Mycobacterium sp. 94-17 TaxID=2986147 RepID=UPI002D1F5166|nr:anti-sigma factor [Mycobacterium sp. 94-17]MEB4211003.1 anti-sigma factor [Mycobacterium sp. 94-17]
MSDPSDFTLLELASAYALDAVSDSERADIEQRIAAVPPSVAAAFHAEVRAVRETMAVVSAHTELDPPPALRSKVLEAVEPTRSRWNRWRTVALAAAAAMVAAVIATGITMTLHKAPTSSTAQDVFAASDVHTASAELPTGGTATIVFSRQRNAAVVVMNNVAPPGPGTVYEMWLLDPNGPRPAGTMDAGNIKPSTTAILPDLGRSTALAFTAEPGRGSARPTTTPFLKLPLS